MQAFHKLSSSFVLMKNKHTISFFYPKACQSETTATRFTPTQRSRTHTRTHTTGSDYIHKNSGVCYEYTPLIYYSYHSYILRTCIVAGRGILGVFGWCGERGEFWSVWLGGEGEPTGEERASGARERRRTRWEGGGRGSASPKVGAKAEARGRGERWEPGEEGGRAAGASGTTWSERRKETATGKGCGSLVNSRPGSASFLTVEIFEDWFLVDRHGGGYWSLVFWGYVLLVFLVIQGAWDLGGKDIITIFVQQS